MNKKMITLIVTATFATVSISALAETKNSSEAGIVSTTGNTKTTSYNVKDQTIYTFAEKNKVQFDGSYLQAKQNGVLSAENWMLGLRYERELSPLWSLFVGQSVEGDQFSGFLQRYNTDAGAKYFIIKKEKDIVWFAEGGYRYTKEHRIDETHKEFQKGRVYTETEKFWTPTTSTKLWLEYVPNFTESEAWLLNGEASVSAALNTMFSIKTAYLVKYNNLPAAAGAKQTDTTFTTALVAKF
jgi:putative salt-induced outer membrane protein